MGADVYLEQNCDALSPWHDVDMDTAQLLREGARDCGGADGRVPRTAGLLLILEHHLDHAARSVGVLALSVLGHREHVPARDAPG